MILLCADPEVTAAAGIELPLPGYLPTVCCVSCHEDADEGVYELLDLTLPDGHAAAVCCRMLHLIDPS